MLLDQLIRLNLLYTINVHSLTLLYQPKLVTIILKCTLVCTHLCEQIRNVVDNK